MKKINSLLAVLLAAFVFINVSCSKDDDDDKSYDKSLLVGTWVQTAGTDFVACPTGDNAKMVITETEVTEYFTTEDGCLQGSSSMTTDYTFDGKKMDLGLATYTIEELNSTTLKVKIAYILGGGSVSATYTKK